MNTSILTEKVKEAIKAQLKQKKLTYKDLAEFLDCSEPTVKRILGGEELTLTRLAEILEFLDLTLSDIATIATKGSEQQGKFTPKQEEFLAKNSNFLAYLVQLYAGHQPKAIAEKHKLDQRSTDKYLIGLERHDLIRVTGKQRVKPKGPSVPHLGKGILAKTHLDRVITLGSNFFRKSISDELYSSQPPLAPQMLSLQHAHVTRKSYDKWWQDFKKLNEDFLKICEIEGKTEKAEDLFSVVTMFSAALVEKDSKGVDPLNNIFGEITKI